jgi:hypothetical protein
MLHVDCISTCNMKGAAVNWFALQDSAGDLNHCVNWLKRKENALVLSLGSFVGPKIDWTDSNYKD